MVGSVVSVVADASAAAPASAASMRSRCTCEDWGVHVRGVS